MMIDRRSALALGGAAVLPFDALAQFAGVTSILDFLPRGEHAAIAAGTSTFDCSAAVYAAWARTSGAIWFPAGRYVIARPLRLAPRAFRGAYAFAPILIGDGPGRTVFVNRVARGAMLDIDAGATVATGFRAFMGLRLEDFSIEGGNVADGAIRLRTCLQGSARRLHITDHRGTGLHVPCLLGDTDGSNQLRFEQIRIENCGGWGVDTYASPGRNENSFLTFDQLFVQNCGTPSAARFPTSGGMRHKGQVMALRQSAFTLNRNVGLWLPGDAGLGSGVTIDETAFENNIGRHLYCTGYDGVSARNIQFYSADAYRVSVACEFNGDNYVMRGIDINGVTVRATKGNSPYLAFRFGGENLHVGLARVAGVVWENFGFPGQSRIEGPVAIQSDNSNQDVRQM
jgi:hypothetical protein